MDKSIAWFFGLCVLFGLFFVAIATHKKRRARKARSVVRRYVFPQHLQQALGEKYPLLTQSDIALVFDGLRQFFLVCVAENQTDGRCKVRMPSRVIDEAWHLFLLDTREYARFCQLVFGQYLHHVPDTKDLLEEDIVEHRQALWNTWFQACELEHIDPFNPHVAPLLFVLDKRFSLPDGYYYVLPTVPIMERHSYNPENDVALAKQRCPDANHFFPIGVLIAHCMRIASPNRGANRHAFSLSLMGSPNYAGPVADSFEESGEPDESGEPSESGDVGDGGGGCGGCGG